MEVIKLLFYFDVDDVHGSTRAILVGGLAPTAVDSTHAKTAPFGHFESLSRPRRPVALLQGRRIR
jgi:hypothetical protein